MLIKLCIFIPPIRVVFLYPNGGMFMINIKIHQTDHDCDVQITGHAGYADPGQDIVCSAVSALWQTMINSMQLTDSEWYTLEDPAFMHISNVDKFAGLLLDSFRIGVQGVAEAYPDHVEVRDW